MKPKLLLIDNDPVQSKLKRISFSKTYDVVLVKHSRELSSVLHADAEPFDVVVLDLMPIRERFIDIMHYLSHLKKDDIPPIFIVANIDVVDRYINLIPELGMCDVVIKPVSLTFIESRVSALTSEQKAPRFHIDGLAMSDHQAMTNAQFFNQHLSRCWLECIRAGQPLSVLYINIDYFALLTSYHGKNHAYHCLRLVQVMMQSLIHRRDDMAVRSRRDDFYVVLPACDERGLQSKIEKLKSMLNEALLANDVSPISPFISVSMGYVTQTPKTMDEINVFLALVKARLNHAKDTRDLLLQQQSQSRKRG